MPYLHINSIICVWVALFINISAACAQTDVTVAGDLSPFLLDKSDMPGFILKWQGKSFIQTSPTTYIRSIHQIWNKAGGDSIHAAIEIDCGLFASIPEALKSMKYRAGSYATPYDWISPDGTIIGDNSFYCSEFNNLSTIFVRGNIGIQIIQPGIKNWITLRDVANRLLNKIENNLSTETRIFEENARIKRISENVFHDIVDSIISILEENEFALSGSEWESKWPTDDVQFHMGRRMEWKNEAGSTFGIDICEFESENDAMKALENRKQFGYVFTMNNNSEVDSLIIHGNLLGAYHKNYLSLVSSNGKYNVHFYMVSPNEELNRGIFDLIVKNAIEKISFVTFVNDYEGSFTEVPKAFTLSQNTPNPFNPSTAISFTLSHPERVNLTVYDALGREVALLASGKYSAGNHTVRWDGRDGRGNAVSSGVYLYRLEAGGKTETRKMLLAR